MAINLILQPLTSAFSGLFDAHPKDVVRLARNAAAYAKAAAGDDNALNFLKYMSGRFGAGQVAADPAFTAGGPASGWATKKAADDAFSKYNAALAARQQIGAGLVGAGVAVSTGSQGATNPVGAVVKAVPTWLWLVLALAVWFFFVRRG